MSRLSSRPAPVAPPDLRLIDLFCGAGGLTLGFTRSEHARYSSVWANDMNPSAAATYGANFGPHCTTADLSRLLDDPEFDVPPSDVVIGGPPCQGFSLLNKQRAGDGRRELWQPYMDVVERSGARAFVMENVVQLLGSHELERIRARAHELGFRVWIGKLCAADYGVAQRRWRAFVVGCRDLDPSAVFPPRPTHVRPDAPEPGRAPWATVRDAVGDLPPPVGTSIRDQPGPLDLHFGRNPTEKSRRRYRAIPDEGMNRFDLQERAPELTPDCWIRKKTGGTDLFGRLWWDRPAFTIRTEFFKPEKGRYLHPEQHRPLTHREAARLQSFPDDFRFVGSKVEIARQIGNAVPPLLGRAVADALASLLHPEAAAHT